MAIPFDALLEESKCYLCLGISQSEAIELALLNRIAEAGGGGSGVESGVIVMWSGSIASIPSGWVLCNGANGTPDLRDRFVPGAGSAYAVGATGGSNTHTHSVTGTGMIDAGAVIADVAPAGNIATTVNVSGDALAADGRPPYYALAYIMKT